MARKALSITTLKTYEDVDHVLRQIGTLDRDIELSEIATQEAIDKVKDCHKAYCEPLHTKRADLERQIKEFASSHRADFADVRTKELTFGSIGFRRSTSIVMAKVADTLAAVKALGLTQCLRIKEELDKEAMRELPTETLTNIGAALQTKDAFGYEIKRDAIPLVGA